MLGKVITVIAMVSGIVVLALPITVLGSNFQKMVEMYEDDAAAYSLVDMSGDGEVDEDELREYLLAKKKEGRLRKDVDTRVASLMDKCDARARQRAAPSRTSHIPHHTSSHSGTIRAPRATST